MPVAGSYSQEDVVVLNTRRTPIQKQPEALLCLVGLSRRYFLGDDVYPTFLNDNDREMDLFNLISAPNPTKVKTGTLPRLAHEVPLLIATATRVIAMEDATGLSSSLGTPSTVEKSPLDFSNEDSPRRITESDGTENQGQETVALEVPPQENVPTVGVTPEIGLEKEVTAIGPLSNIGERSTMLDTGSTLSAPTLQETPADVSDPDPLSYAKLQSIPEREIAQEQIVAGTQNSEKSTSLTPYRCRLAVAMGFPALGKGSRKSGLLFKLKSQPDVANKGVFEGIQEAIAGRHGLIIHAFALPFAVRRDSRDKAGVADVVVCSSTAALEGLAFCSRMPPHRQKGGLKVRLSPSNVPCPRKDRVIHGSQFVCSISKCFRDLIRSFLFWAKFPSGHSVTCIIAMVDKVSRLLRVPASLPLNPNLAVALHCTHSGESNS
ncbi:hypothetical protein Tco_1184203 [Tanacetum coccineum]